MSSDLYLDDLFNKRIILIDRDISSESCSEWIGKIALLDIASSKTKRAITLFINSYGGDPYAAFGLMDVMKNSVSPITTVCIGVAMSAASVVLGAGKRRCAVPNARIMIHQHSDELGPKNHVELLNEAEESNRLFKQLANYYGEITGLSAAKVKRLLGKDSYMTAQTALELGLIDEIGWRLHDWIK